MCNNEGRNALMYSCKLGLPEIVKVLLNKNKCDLCQKDQHGHTALIMCCHGCSPSETNRQNRTTILKMLLTHKNSGIHPVKYHRTRAYCSRVT